MDIVALSKGQCVVDTVVTRVTSATWLVTYLAPLQLIFCAPVLDKRIKHERVSGHYERGTCDRILTTRILFAGITDLVVPSQGYKA